MAGRVLVSILAPHTAPCKSPRLPRAVVLSGQYSPPPPAAPPQAGRPTGPGLKVTVLLSGGSAESRIPLEC